jgi:hypothetical protein
MAQARPADAGARKGRARISASGDASATTWSLREQRVGAAEEVALQIDGEVVGGLDPRPPAGTEQTGEAPEQPLFGGRDRRHPDRRLGAQHVGQGRLGGEVGDRRLDRGAEALPPIPRPRAGAGDEVPEGIGGHLVGG